MSAGSGIAWAAVFVVAALALGNDPGADADGLPICTTTTSLETTSGTSRQPAASAGFGDVTPDCELHEDQGDNDAISALQSALVICHGQVIAVDGEFGPATERALTTVQAQLGITADGVYGPVTRQSMQWPATSASGGTTCVATGV